MNVVIMCVYAYYRETNNVNMIDYILSRTYKACQEVLSCLSFFYFLNDIVVRKKNDSGNKSSVSICLSSYGQSVVSVL